MNILIKSFILVLNFFISYALYEDQVGKLDWRRLHIGKIKEATFDLNPNNNVALVITEANVLAAIDLKTSAIKWRQIFETNDRGNLKFFHKTNKAWSALNNNKHSSNLQYDILTISGVAPSIIRGWHGMTGNLQWEWSMMPLKNDQNTDLAWHYYENNYLYHVLPIENSHLEVTKYVVATGQSQKFTTKIIAPWIKRNSCILAESYFVCIDNNQLISIDITEDDQRIYRKSLSPNSGSSLKAIKNKKGFVLINNEIVSVKADGKSCSISEKITSLIFTKIEEKEFYVFGELKDNVFVVKTMNAETCEENKNLQFKIKLPNHCGTPKIVSAQFNEKEQDNHLLISTEDGALLYVQEDEIQFIREESLADIAAVELLDLPLSDTEGALENNMNISFSNIIGAFLTRIRTQIMQLRNSLFSLVGIGLQSIKQKTTTELKRDAFGLRKMLVVLTKSGKLFGIDNLSGKQHWIQYIGQQIKIFDEEQIKKIIVQRTSKHYPFEPICTIIGKDKETENGVLYQFNPISGQPFENGLIKLNFKIKQFAVLRENNDFIRGLLLLDYSNNVHVIPKTTEEKAIGFFLYIVDKEAASLSGFYVNKINEKLEVIPTWKVRLSGQANNHEIVRIAPKNPIEHVHSQGRVLGDRSVLYKYINPNLIAVVTQAADSIHKYIMNVYLIDVVSGSIVFSMTHRKVKNPIHVVHSENWLAYSYYNEKVRRTEITTLELYEGKVQGNNTVWSSLDAPPVPIVEKQSFIFPAQIETMRETITERGITNKHILIGLSSGAILEMPWAFLDPRRPIFNQQREEGVIPYIPELPIPTENIINYNQSIAKIRNIYTAPSGLESTCLVVAYGLDLYVTRVSPSKTFDLLKEDFDYFLISVVLLGLIAGSLITKYLASRKALKQAWK